MANTEKIKAIRLVRKARTRVREARFEPPVPDPMGTKLEKLYSVLDQLEDDLILRELDDALVEIDKSAGDLRLINDEIRETNEELKAVAKMVDKAADGVKALVQVASFAASGGLI